MLPAPLASVDSERLAMLNEQPELIWEQARELQWAIAQHPDTPPTLLAVLANSPTPDIAEAAKLHVNRSGEVTFKAAIQIVFDWLRQAELGQNDRLALELLKLGPIPVDCLSIWVPVVQVQAAAKQEAMPLHYRLGYWERLSWAAELEPRLELAAAVETPVTLLERLVGALEPEIRQLVKLNPSCPSALVNLVEGQWAIATNETTRAEELIQLSHSSWPWIRQAVASNPAAPAEALTQLANDSILSIQAAVAENPATPEAVLARLAQHPTAKVQAMVAANASLSEALQLEFLEKHRRTIRARNDLKLGVLEKIYQLEAARTDVPLWKNPDLRSLLLRNRNTSEELLEKLIAAYDPAAIAAFYQADYAQKKQTLSPELLTGWIIQAADYLKEVVKHPNCTAALLELTLAQVAQVEQTHSNHQTNREIEAAIFNHAQTPDGLQERLAFALLGVSELEGSRETGRWFEVLAHNPKTPKTVLDKLVARYCEEPKWSLTFAKQMAQGQLSKSLETAIQTFLEQHQSPRALQTKLRQEPDARAEALHSWSTFLTELSPTDREVLYSLCQMSMGAIGLNGGFPKADAGWAGTRPEAMLLFGFFMLFDMKPGGQARLMQGQESVVAALAWHPALSEVQRQTLRSLIPDLNVKWDDGRSQARWHQALALNPFAPEADRAPYLTQIIALHDSNHYASENKRQLARSPHTPTAWLRQLMPEGNDYFHSYLASNPSLASEDLVALLPKELNSLLRNPSFQASDAVDWLLNDPSPSAPTFDMGWNTHWSVVERQRVKVAARQRRDRQRAEEIATNWPHRHRKAKQEAARSWHSTPEQLDILARDQDVVIRQWVAANGKLSAAGQCLLAQDPDPEVRLNLAKRQPHAGLDPVAAATLFEQSVEQKDRNLHLALAQNETTPSEIIKQLYQLNDPDITAHLLTHPNTPTAVLQREIPLITDEKRLETVLRGSRHQRVNPAMPAAVLDPLAKHPKDVIRFLVARYPSASAEALEKLSQDDHDLTRQTAAANPSTPAHALIAMAKRECQNSGSATNYHCTSHQILRRKDAPPEALDWIARNPTRRGNWEVGRHANTTTETLDWIANHDSDDATLTAVAKHPNASEAVLLKLTEQGSEAVRAAVATQPRCPSHILPLELLSQHPSLTVCLSIATNPATPAEYLDLFVTSQKAALRAAVASNPSLSPDALTTLAEDPKVEVRLAVARNPQTPEPVQNELRSLLLTQAEPPESPTMQALAPRPTPDSDLPELLRTYAQSDNAFVRFATLLNPQTPPEILAQGAASAYWIERYAVAENTSLPGELREILRSDSNCIGN